MSTESGVDVAGLPRADVDDVGRPTVGSLFSAEWLRLRSRRLVKIVLLGALILFAVIVVGTFVKSGTPTPADLARAQQQADAASADCIRSVTSDPNLPAGTDPSQVCGTVDPSLFLSKAPFDFVGSYKGGRIGVAAIVAALLFLIGASAGGAEWSARTMPALLYWEPRRLRVMAVKTAVLGLFAVTVSLAAQALWLASALVLRALKGITPTPALPDQFWTDSVGVAGRGLVLAALVALGAFALANLTRNTGAALGIAFVYFAVVENVVQQVAPKLARWTLVNNVGGFLVPGGIDVTSGVNPPPTLVAGQDSTLTSFVHLSNLRGGIVLTCVTLAALVIATALFRSRDIT